MIDLELILVNLLKNGKCECTIKDLLNIKDKIEKEILDVFIDITRQSIFFYIGILLKNVLLDR